MRSDRSSLAARIFLFCDSVAGARSSANHYSLIETAKANGIEPYAYLKMIFTELPQASSLEEIEALLPVPADAESLAKVSCCSLPAMNTRC